MPDDSYTVPMAGPKGFDTMMAMDRVVVRKDGILDAQLGAETVLMSADNDQYYALTATSRDIWHRLETPTRVGDLCQALAEAYGVPVDTVEPDTLAFLDFLDAERLLD